MAGKEAKVKCHHQSCSLPCHLRDTESQVSPEIPNYGPPAPTASLVGISSSKNKTHQQELEGVEIHPRSEADKREGRHERER